MGLIEAAVHAAQPAVAAAPHDIARVHVRAYCLWRSRAAPARCPECGRDRGRGCTFSATVLGIFFVPVFFVVVRRLLKPPRLGEVAGPSNAEAH
jgi:hypothetical protein